MSEEHSMECVDEHRCDLGLIAAWRQAVIPTLTGTHNSAMYQLVVDGMGDLIREVECLRRESRVTHVHVTSVLDSRAIVDQIHADLLRMRRLGRIR